MRNQLENRQDDLFFPGGLNMRGFEGGIGPDCGCCRGKMEIERILRRNIGRVVNIHTEVMGNFTGLVTRVDDSTVRLTTSVPSAPFERGPFSMVDGNCDFKLDRHCKNSHFGSSVIIPICKIVAVSVIEI